MIPIKFIPEIHLGHVLQAVVFAVTIPVAASTVYYGMKSDITATQNTVGLLRQRLDQDELASNKKDQADTAFQDRMSKALDDIRDRIADLKVTVATANGALIKK